MVQTKLFDGEQYLIQTVDEKLAFTTHRLIQNRAAWSLQGSKHILLEDILRCEVKVTGKPLYLALSTVAALLVYYDNSFMLLSGFFLMLYLMTRHQRIHIKTADASIVLPLEVEEEHFTNLLNMVRQAKQTRSFDISIASDYLKQMA